MTDKPALQHHSKAAELPFEKDDMIESTDFVPGRGYWFLLSSLVLLCLIVGIKSVEQTQERHETYRKLSAAQLAFRAMKTEEERLIIEQQTFSATPIVAQRAVSELGMFYPAQSHRVVVPSPNR